MSSPLLLVPNEILANIALHLASLSPLALPDLLLPLRSAAKTLDFRLSPSANPSLYARIFRFKFDYSAVCRRAFVPDARNYADHLIHYYKLLAAIQRRDFDADDTASILFAAYIMMLENDGKNRAQLELAGIDLYLDAYVRKYMYHPFDRMTNDGWPRDNTANACALWLIWMFTTPEKLRDESIEEREQIASSALPFASIPFRYASAHAPPLHFKLPLTTSADGDDDNFFSIQTVHGLYPIYRRTEFAWSQFYYGSRPLLTYPLASEAAKLVYQSRRDMTLFPIPPHLLPTRADANASGLTEIMPTQEDIRELNAHKSARLVKRIIWDWDRGVAVVPGEANDGIAFFDASRDWDSDWWRLRCCWDAWRKQPRWRPGRVYMPGVLSGLWQGKMLIPSELAMMHFLNAPEYPSPFFLETTLTITTRPIFMRLSEHHCLDQRSRLSIPHQKTGPFQDDGVQNAWFPGPPGSLRWQFADRPDGQRIEVHTLSGHTAEYHTYNPEGSNAEWLGYEHDRDSCPGCIAREVLVTSSAQLERRKWKEEEQQRQVEQTFASVGLCRGTGIPFRVGNPDMEIDDEESEDDDSEWDIMDDEYDDNPTLPPVRKSQDWVRNVVECDGVRDVIVTGATDDAHGQAWHHYTYYGRVRPWDGLIGILRVPRASLQGTSFIYGYISGGKNFSGNWRWALADPAMPAWECAVIMSKREE
ncbi:hypothetical protein APHAL10511_005081 [Amanita phalloides]|nr:hypothetical protein APHAL10511_005081 [Amanita phalloides]